MSFSIASGSHALVSGAQVLRCITVEFRWPRRLHATFAGPRKLRKTLPAAHLQRIVGWPVDATTQLDFLPLASTTQASMRGACLRFVKESCDATQRLS